MLETTTCPRGLRAVLGGALVLAMCTATGCGGAMAFSDDSSLVIVGDLPPPPPKPKPKPAPPPPPPKRVEVTADKIVIRDKIMFESGKSTIREESFELLDEIAGVFNDNPHIKKVSIEGHTDAQGSEKYNQKLSDGRAKAVLDYLVEHDVDAGRLSSQGFGESKPIGDNETEEGREENRRVEFIITEQDEVKKTVEIDPKTGKPVETQEGE